MQENTTFVGLDVHAKKISVAVLMPRTSRFVEWQIDSDDASVRKLAQRLKQLAPGALLCCYEAGPTGYGLKRLLNKLGVPCQVIAPSLVPYRPGDRVKTDRRDARKLAELLRANLLTEVTAPGALAESHRELVRLCDTLRRDLMRARQRVGKFLLRHSVAPPLKMKAWTQRHRKWLDGVRMENAVLQRVLDELRLALATVLARRDALLAEVEVLAQDARYCAGVAALSCHTGVKTLTAMIFMTEVHQIERFGSARSVMKFIGLVPGESSTGEKQHRLGITKAGNGHARRALIEAAHHYRHPARASAAALARQRGQDARVVALAQRARMRLSGKYQKLVFGRGKSPNVAACAIARELAGFLWATLRIVAGTPTEA